MYLDGEGGWVYLDGEEGWVYLDGEVWMAGEVPDGHGVGGGYKWGHAAHTG